MIRWTNLPRVFVQDSIEREIFRPESDTHATEAQLRSLMADAEYYGDPDGPDMASGQLKASARATVKRLRIVLALARAEGRDG